MLRACLHFVFVWEECACISSSVSISIVCGIFFCILRKWPNWVANVTKSKWLKTCSKILTVAQKICLINLWWLGWIVWPAILCHGQPPTDVCWNTLTTTSDQTHKAQKLFSMVLFIVEKKLFFDKKQSSFWAHFINQKH